MNTDMHDILEKIKARFGNVFPKHPVVYIRDGVRPARDWTVILSLAFILLCIVAAGSLYIYIQIQNGAFITQSDNQAIDTIHIDTQLLSTTIREMDARDASAAALGQSSSPGDPSL